MLASNTIRALVAVALFAVALFALGAPAWAEERVIDLPIHDGELPKDKRVARVRQGDDVTLRWTTNKTVTVHLHGYDVEKKLSPGAPVSMRFPARATGRFPIEIHPHGRGGERTLGYLEVHPR